LVEIFSSSRRVSPLAAAAAVAAWVLGLTQKVPLGTGVVVGVTVGVGVGVVVAVGVGVGFDVCVGVGVLTGAPVQATPLSRNAAGVVLAPLHEPLKPKLAVLPVPRLPFQDMFFTVTAEPLWLGTPFHSCWIDWPDGNVQSTLHELTGSPRLVTVTLAPKPPPHWFVTA
jgi:hypothetical protein